MTDKELSERYRMALEAILMLNKYSTVEIAQAIAKQSLKTEEK